MKPALYTALFALLLPSLSWGETPNLVVNGSMEAVENEAPSGWRIHSGKAALTTVPGENGNALGIQLEGERAQSWLRSATIQVKPNTTYRLSLEFKGDGPASTLAWMGVKVYESEGGWNPEGGHYLIQQRATRAWQTKEATFTTRDNTKWLYIGILVQDPGGGTLSLDNITLHPVE